MNVAAIIQRAIKNKGLQTLRETSQVLNISAELLRRILNENYLPKDKTLFLIATGLGLDAHALILAAHEQRLPEEAKNFVLAPGPSPYREGKRKFPLSQEQCDYLGKLMTPGEIQLVRKYRQVNEEARISIRGYIDYTFGTKRQAAEQPAVPAKAPQIEQSEVHEMTLMDSRPSSGDS